MWKITLLFMLSSLALSEETTGSCLANDVLTGLGLTGATMEPITDPTYCTEVYATPGRCITADTIKEYIEAKQTKFTEYNAGFVEIDDQFNTFFGNIGSSLAELWAKITDSTSEKSWKDKMGEVTKKAEDSVNKCFMSYNQITHGASCFLSSGLAGQKAAVADKKITIDATDSVLQVVGDCIDVISAICLFWKGGDEAKVDTSQTEDQKKLCQEHQDYQKCITDGGAADSCLNERKEKIFELMYSYNSNKWIPDATNVKSVADKVLAWFSDAKDKIFSWFKSTDEANTSETTTETTTARLLAEDYEIVFKIVASDGADIWKIGGASGVTIKGVAIQACLKLMLLVPLFFGLN